MNDSKLRRFSALILLFATLVWLPGCIQAPVVPPLGAIYTGTVVPLDIDLEKTQLKTTKTGDASCTTILGLFAFGDASVAAAAADGRMDTVEHADYEFINVLGIYQKYTTIVYGN